jgi:uncharacterized membrane protein YphA (DoxX/SURF4 family)
LPNFREYKIFASGNTRGVAQVISQITLGGIFIYASIGKILGPASFATSISNYKLLPGFLVGPTAIALPYAELLCGTLLILNIRSRAAALFLTSLLVVFIIAILSTIARGINIDCGCFASFSQEPVPNNKNQWISIFRNLVLLLLGAIVIFAPQKDKIPPAIDR